MKTPTWQIQVPGLTHCPLAPQPAGQIGLRQRLVGGFTWAESSLQILRLHPIIIIVLLILWFWELAHLPAWTTLTASSTPTNIGSACSRYFQMYILIMLWITLKHLPLQLQLHFRLIAHLSVLRYLTGVQWLHSMIPRNGNQVNHNKCSREFQRLAAEYASDNICYWIISYTSMQTRKNFSTKLLPKKNKGTTPLLSVNAHNATPVANNGTHIFSRISGVPPFERKFYNTQQI